MDAGVQEEIFSRLFLMTLFVWLGSLVWREPDGRPTRVVFWIAIIISGVECAILAHFFLDAVGTGIVAPAYLSSEPLVLVSVLSVLIIAGLLSWRYLVRAGSQAGTSIS